MLLYAIACRCIPLYVVVFHCILLYSMVSGSYDLRVASVCFGRSRSIYRANDVWPCEGKSDRKIDE